MAEAAGTAATGKLRELVRFLPDCLVLFRRLLRDPRVPRRAKIVLALLVAVVLGYVVRRAGRPVIEEHWPGSRPGSGLY